MARSLVNRRDPTGTKRIEREEIARQREVIRLYTEAMAEVATGNDPDRTAKLERLSEALKEDLASSADKWINQAAESAVRVSDHVMNNLHTGIVLGNAVPVPKEEIEMLKANIVQNVRSVGGDLLKTVTRITAEGYQNGWGADKTAREIVKAGEGSVRHAKTIVRTETLRVSDTILKARYSMTGIDGYLSFPTDDDRLCTECIRKATGGSGTSLKVYRLDEAMALPWHPNCRCMRLPHFPDQEDIKI